MNEQKTTALKLPLTSGRYLLRNGKVAIIKKNNRQRDKAKWPWRGRILDKEYISRLDFDVWNSYGEHSETETLYCEEVSQYDIVARLPDSPLPWAPAPDKPQSTSSETLTGNIRVGEDQTAEIGRLRTELEQSQGVRTRLAAEVEQLKAQLRDAFSTAQQLRSDKESLAAQRDTAEAVAAETLLKLETTERLCLRIITELAKGV